MYSCKLFLIGIEFFLPRSRNASKSNKSRESEGAVNEAFGNNAQDNCVDDQGHMCQALISDDGVVLDL